MTPDESFLQAILDHPDDEAPRLMYADWLTEHGDPRGEFIRIQCQLATISDDDPLRPHLEARERALLQQHEAEWLAPLRGLVKTAHLRRGFIEDIALTAHEFIAHGKLIFQRAPVLGVRLSELHQVLPTVADFNLLDGLRRLDLSRNLLTPASMEALAGLPQVRHLTTLILNHNPIGDAGVEALVKSPYLAHLGSLDLVRTQVTDVALRHIAGSPNLPNLAALRLDHNNVTGAGLGALLDSPALKRLASVHLPRGVVDQPLVGALFSTNRLCWLMSRGPTGKRTLDLCGCQLDELTVDDLTRTDQLDRAQCLLLRGVGLTPEGAASLATSLHLGSVTSADLSRNPLGDNGVAALVSGPGLSGLRWLELQYANIRDEGAIALATSPHLNRLVHLDLSSNAIGGPGFRSMASSWHLKNLTSLHLRYNSIGDEGAIALAGSRYLEQLEELDLRFNEIGPEGAQALASSPYLTRVRKLVIWGNHLEPDDRDLLVRKFGNAVQT